MRNSALAEATPVAEAVEKGVYCVLQQQQQQQQRGDKKIRSTILAHMLKYYTLLTVEFCYSDNGTRGIALTNTHRALSEVHAMLVQQSMGHIAMHKTVTADANWEKGLTESQQQTSVEHWQGFDCVKHHSQRKSRPVQGTWPHMLWDGQQTCAPPLRSQLVV